MKLLRKKNGQWFTVSVAVGMLMALGSVSQDVSAKEVISEIREVTEYEEVVEQFEDKYAITESAEVSVIDDVKSPSVAESATDLREASNDVATESAKQDDEYREDEVPEEDASPQEGYSIKKSTEDVAPVDLDELDNVKDTTVKTLKRSSGLDEALSQIGDEEEKRPQSEDSNQIIHAPQAWRAGYRGEGEVVAIIDSGIDPTHDAFGRLSDMTKARYQTQEQFEKAKLAAGIEYGRWVNEKLIFGYNYIDADIHLKENDLMSHGQHVAGTAVGNPSRPVKLPTLDNPNNEEYIYGVAPEAQLMVMRVFSDLNGGTREYLYARAIEDAVKLGATSINLSLGGGSGSLYETSYRLSKAIADANAAGVSVVIAAGNSRSFGQGHSNPKASDPDIGVVGSPSTAQNSISVASVNSTTAMEYILKVEGLEKAEFNHGNLMVGFGDNNTQEILRQPEFAEGEFEYEVVGLGKEEDFAGRDLSGKFALVKRGEISFEDKALHAKRAGAKGVVVYNHDSSDDEVRTMVLGDNPELKDFPALFITNRAGEELAANADKYRLKPDTQDRMKFDNPNKGELSSFSSWGLTADGELKPDVTAPGGGIFAPYNNNEYGPMSGTSMASPHVAGAVALIKQGLRQKYPDLSGGELTALVKNLLMSTATIHTNSETGAFTSPRQQGAGIINVDKALKSDLYVTNNKGYGSVSLYNVGDQLRFDVVVHNRSNEAKTLTYQTHLNTDATKDSPIGPLMSLQPRHLKTTERQTLTVEAGESKTISITVDASEFSEELLTQMKNGYFLEGYVVFNDEAGQGLVNIPYVGFRGDFSSLRVVETPIYDLEKGEVPFYYYANVEEQVVDPHEDHYTSLVTAVDTGKDKPQIQTLGADTVDPEGNFLEQGKDMKLALSPNGDGHKDELGFKGVFLRNYEDFVASIYALDDVAREKVLWRSEKTSGRKNYFDGQDDKSTLVPESVWNGLDYLGNLLADGQYKYVVNYRPVVPGADLQELTFDLTLDTQLTMATAADFDVQLRKLTFRNYKELANDLSGINPFRTSIGYKDGSPLAEGLPRLYMNEDLTFDIPEGVDITDKRLVLNLEDKAGNRQQKKLNELLIGMTGVVKFRLLDEVTGENYAKYGFRVLIRDEAGNIVETIEHAGKKGSTLRLPFGTYTAETFLYDIEYLEVVGSTQKTFTVSFEKSVQTVDFLAKQTIYREFRVQLNESLPQGATVYAVDAAGKRYLVPTTSYHPDRLQVRLPEGTYTIVVELPAGYSSEQNGAVVELTENSSTFHLAIEQIEVAPVVDLNPFVEEVLNINEQIEAEEQVDKGALLNKWLEKTKEAEEQAEEEAEVSSEPEQQPEGTVQEQLEDSQVLAKKKVEANLAIIRSEQASEGLKRDYLALVRQADSAEAVQALLAEFQQKATAEDTTVPTPPQEPEEIPEPGLKTIKNYFKLVVDFDGEQVVYDRKDSDVWASEEHAREVYDQYLPEVIERDGKEYERINITFKQSAEEAILIYVFKLKTDLTVAVAPPAEENESVQETEKPVQPERPEIEKNQSTGKVIDSTDDNQLPDDSNIETGKGLIRPDKPAFEGGVNHHKAAIHEKTMFPDHQLQALLQVEKNKAKTYIATLSDLTATSTMTYQEAIQQANNIPTIEQMIRQAVTVNEQLTVQAVMNEITDQKNKSNETHILLQTVSITDRTSQSANKQLAEKATEGERLPDTATSSWIIGLVGVSSLLAGVSVKKLKNDK
ncbi:S8 family serine peptidase [Dolosigranulum pigrum]|uniref:S8 family serine peptidase n=1 Tax=Dolosigranulum pigrum TaxID=29394 RepID=UPI001AD89CFF|nr:S8 family serine peptidase [Dolosigranulum pigrum]